MHTQENTINTLIFIYLFLLVVYNILNMLD